MFLFKKREKTYLHPGFKYLFRGRRSPSPSIWFKRKKKGLNTIFAQYVEFFDILKLLSGRFEQNISTFSNAPLSPVFAHIGVGVGDGDGVGVETDFRFDSKFELGWKTLRLKNFGKKRTEASESSVFLHRSRRRRRWRQFCYFPSSSAT